MKFLKVLVLIFTLSVVSNIQADDNEIEMASVLRFNAGLLLNSYAEKEDSLVSTDGTTSTSTPYKGSATNIAFEAQYEKFLSYQKSFYLLGGGTILGGDSKYFNIGTGMNYYFSPLASKSSIEETGFQLKLTPKLRYYAGGGISGAYMVYNTISDSKGDFLFEIGAHGGVIYPLQSKWSLTGEVGLSRAVGTLISNTQIRLMFGISASLGDYK